MERCARWDILPAGDNAYIIQVDDPYFDGWHLAPPSSDAPSTDLRPGLAKEKDQPTRWEFRAP